MRKRILALLLALVMCLSLLPTAAFAEDVTDTTDTTDTDSSTITTAAPTTGDDTATGGNSTTGDDTATGGTSTTTGDSTATGEDADTDTDSDESAAAPAPLLSAASTPMVFASTGEHKHGENGSSGGTVTDKTWTAWSTANALPSTAGYYYLTDDVTLSGSWWPQDDTHLCLNGYNIILDADTPVIILAKGRSFYLTDCTYSEQGKITHTEGKSGCGVSVMDGTNTAATEFWMYGGHITGNTTTNEGGGVDVAEYGKFIMSGGTISGNSAKRGGGVFLEANSTFLMTGGSIRNNHATGSAEYGGGGGVYNLSNSFIMTGGSIKDNTADRDGGGVYGAGAIHKYEGKDKTPQYSSAALTTFTLSGSANITGNTVGGKANNLYVPNWLYSIDVTENFKGSFGVTVDEYLWSQNIVASPNASTPGGPEYIWGNYWQVINCAGSSLPANVIYDNDHFAIESHTFAPKKLICQHYSAAGTIWKFPFDHRSDANMESYTGCPICKNTVAAEVTFTTGGETQSRCFDTAELAYYAAATPTNTANSTIMKLITDGSLGDFADSKVDTFLITLNGRSITIDLNGKTLKVNSKVSDRKLHLKSGTLTIKDSGINGTIEAFSTLVVDNGAVLVVEDGKLSGALTVKSGGRVTLPGTAAAKATITGALTVEKNGTLELKGIDGGCPIINTLDVQSGGKVTLGGVMFQKITVDDGVISDILAPNHSVFYYSDGYHVVNANAKTLDAATVTGSADTSLQVLTNGTNRHICAYNEITTDGKSICGGCGRICTHGSIDSTTGRCGTCGSTIKAQVTPMFTGGAPVYYPTLEAAAASIGDSGLAIIKLLADVDNANVTLQGSLVTLELNGKTLAGKMSVGGDADATMISIKGDNLWNVDLTVKNALFTWQDENGAIGSAERKLKSLTLKNSNAILRLGENATIGTLKNQSGSAYALSNMVFAGYVLTHDNNQTVNGKDTMPKDAVWNNAKLEECQHNTEAFNADTGYCSRCNKQFKVRMQAGSANTYYDKLSDAVSALPQSGAVTLRLLTNVEEKIAGDTQEISLNRADPLTLLLNGKTLTANITVPAESIGKLIMSSGGKLDGTLAVNGGTVELSGGTFGKITVTGDGKTVADLLKDGYGYRNAEGWVTNEALAVTELSNVSVARTITVSVAATPTTIGGTDTATLTATVEGTSTEATPTYAWYEVGSDGAIAGATEASYTTPAAGSLSTGQHQYYCTATVDGYTATSNTVTITVKGTLTPSGESGSGAGGGSGESGSTSTDTYTAPTGKTGLTYTGEALELIEAGEVPTGCTMKYRLKTGDTTYTVWDTTIPTGKNAGEYTVQWYIVGGTSYDNVGSDTEPAGSISVTIARQAVSLNPCTVYAETGKQVSINLTEAVGATIPGTETLTFALASGAPTGMSINDNTLTFLPAVDDTYTATVTVTSKNYSGTLAVEIVSNTKQNPVVTVTAYEKTYDGREVALDNIGKEVTTEGVTGTWSWTNAGTAPKNVADSAGYQVTFTPTEASANTYNPVTVSVQVTIKPVTLTVDGLDKYHPTKTYDGTVAADTTGLSLKDTVNGETLTSGTDYTIAAVFNNANAGTNKTVYVTAALAGTEKADNYSLAGSIFTARGTINQAELTLAQESGYTLSKTYDGTAAAKTEGLSLSGTVNGETLAPDTDYTITAAFDSADVGADKNVTITAALANTAKAANYCFKVDGSASRTTQKTMTADIYPIVLTTPLTAKADPVKLQQNAAVRNGSCLLFNNVNVVLPQGVTLELDGELHFALGTRPARVSAQVDETTGMLTYTISGGKAGDKFAIPVTVTLPNFVQQDSTKEENQPVARGVNDAPQELDPNADVLTLGFTVEIELTGGSQQMPDNPFAPSHRPTIGGGGNGSGSGNGGSGGSDPINRQPTPTGAGSGNGANGGASGNGSTSGNGSASGNGGTSGSGSASGNGGTSGSGSASGSDSASGSGVASPGTADAGIAVYAMLSLSAALGCCATGCTILSRKRRRG